MDFAKMSTNKLPKDEMKKVLGMLAEHYRCRMAKTWIVNTNGMINAMYKMASVFLDAETKEKIKLTSKSFTDDMTTVIHPSQLWKKYGGEAEEPAFYWPPQVPSREFGEDASTIKSEEEYL